MSIKTDKPTYEELLDALRSVVDSYDDTGCERCGVIDEKVFNRAEKLVEACKADAVVATTAYEGTLGIECETNECDATECHRCFPRKSCPHHAKCKEFTASGEAFTDKEVDEEVKGLVGDFDSDQSVCPACSSADIANNGPPEDDARIFVTCYDCGKQWHEPREPVERG